MNPQVAIEPGAEENVVDTAMGCAPPLVAVPADTPSPATAVVQVSLEPCPPPSLEANESLIRRALAAADMTAIALVLLAVLSRFGIDVGLLVALASLPVVVLLFKIAGLYNRDELRLGHSTLDEVPLVLQLTCHSQRYSSASGKRARTAFVRPWSLSHTTRGGAAQGA